MDDSDTSKEITMREYDTVVVGVDFTENARNALLEAARLAGPRGHMYAVHVIESQIVDDMREVLEAAAGFEGSIITELKVRLGEIVSDVFGGGDGPIVHVEVESGSPSHELLESMRRHNAQLLVMARNSTSDPAGGAGACAVQCVRHARNDVLLVRETHKGPYRTIMACIDFSDASHVAADRAAALAQRDGAEVHLAHAFRPPWEVVPFAAVPMAASGDYQTQHMKMLERQLQQVQHTLEQRHPQMKIHRHLEPAGSVGTTLVDTAQSINADLAVLGSHGRGRIERLLLGSTAERVIRNATCSVLTVRPAEGHDGASVAE